VKISKVFRWFLVVFLILIVAGLFGVHFFGARVLRHGIEIGATQALNVGVSVGGVELSVLGGRAELSELVIHNPPGYQHEHLLKLGRGQVKLRVFSLFSERVEIEQVKLEEVELVLEQRGLESNNLQDILGHLSHTEQPAEASKKKLHIGELEITSVTVHVKLLPILGKADTIILNLSPIRMTNLGSDNKLDTAVLSEKILLAISGGIIEKGIDV